MERVGHAVSRRRCSSATRSSPRALSAELIAERWEICARRVRRDRAALPAARRARRPPRAASNARSSPFTVDGSSYASRPGHPPRDHPRRASRRCSRRSREDGVLTAGNSSQVSDGAAAVLLMSREKASELGLRPRARIVDQLTVGVDPILMLTGPIPATRQDPRAQRDDDRRPRPDRDQRGVRLGDRARGSASWSADLERVNVNGGAIALGHPLGSTGARLLTTLAPRAGAHERDGSGS